MSMPIAVALLAEGVDRNIGLDNQRLRLKVALLAEGVDRNIPNGVITKITKAVALLAEGVDRNGLSGATSLCGARSPSSRRAWIEIIEGSTQRVLEGVALLAEGVDRNRAARGCGAGLRRVALLAEGVDRNTLVTPRLLLGLSRPPRGGRG